MGSITKNIGRSFQSAFNWVPGSSYLLGGKHDFMDVANFSTPDKKAPAPLTAPVADDAAALAEAQRRNAVRFGNRGRAATALTDSGSNTLG